jgi:hypothetical protein
MPYANLRPRSQYDFHLSSVSMTPNPKSQLPAPHFPRRMVVAALLSSASAFAAACGTGSPGATVLDTPEGRVLQYEGDDLLVLVSGAQPSYHIGESIHLNLIVNNQSDKSADVRLRTKVLGRGDQPVVQLEPALLSIRPDDAASVDQDVPLGTNLVPGDYTLSVEVPPWKLEGRDFGRGATLRAPVHLDPPAASSG